VRLAGVIRESIVDGPGLRFVVFAQGCPHGCPGCHNPQTHDFAGGYECPVERIAAAIAENPLITGVTFSGGEPFCQAQELAVLAQLVKEQHKHLILYSGYTFEQLLHNSDPAVRRLMEYGDLLIDGPFLEREKTLELRFRGSRNQRVIDLPASLAQGQAVEVTL
jgi:anaerobic ribonucleoside-triphosphate reductase activating protein